MAKRQKFKSVDREINHVIEQISQESSRAAVIVLAAELDLALRDILEEYFLPENAISRRFQVSLFGPDEPAGSFLARIELAYRLGIIPEWCQQELHLIRKIRNEFSHGVVELTFTDSPVRELIGQLRVPSKIRKKHEDAWKKGFGDDPKEIFILAGSIVLAELQTTYLNLRDHNYLRPEPCLRDFTVPDPGDEA